MRINYAWFKKIIKLSVYFLLFYSGILHLVLAAYRRIKKRHLGVILFYHRFKEKNEATAPYKLHIKSFERQMLHLKRWYNVITLDKLVENIKNGGNLSHLSVVITIDDGFKDNYDLAYPILKGLNLPATIFLTSGFINTQKAPWVDEIGIALAKTQLDNLYVPQLFGDQVVAISSNEQKAETLHRIYKKLLYLEHNTKVDLVDTLLSILNKKGDLRAHERIMLNWKEIKKMSQNNISFGSHTLTHPTLSKMGPEDAMFEIIESKRIIEKELGACVRHFAIPNGQNEDFTEALREFCKNGLFDSIATTNFGEVTKFSDPYKLPRVCPSEPLYCFAVDLARLFIVGGIGKRW